MLSKWILAVMVAVSSSSPASAMERDVYDLSSFGPVATAAEAEATLRTATAEILAKGGGTLVIAAGVAPAWQAHNVAPSSTRAAAPTLTVVDRRGGIERVLLASNGSSTGMAWAGRHIQRHVHEPVDTTFGVHTTEAIDTFIAGGTTSYSQLIVEPVKAGQQARIYVPSLRGLAVGNHMVLAGRGEAADRGPIQALGWDKQKGLPYATMDVSVDHATGALFYNKHVVNSMTITDYSQSDNQSAALSVARKNYGQGDSFVVSASARSMSNIMSGTGDEGGLTFSADISNDLRPFRSKVERMDWSRSELVYAPGPVRNHTLGTGRPLINLNPKKHITRGRVWIVAPGQRPFRGADGTEFPGEAIISSKDCPWPSDVVGRFFAVDEEAEYLDPERDHEAGYTSGPDVRAHRWYQIKQVEQRRDGTRRLFVERTRWYARNEAVPKLYDYDNYSRSGHLKPLRYIIAPGAMVSDVSRAWTNSERSGGHVYANEPRTLVLGPSTDANTRFDFGKDDPVAQAIGSDPWNVTGMRVRHFNYIPSTIEDASYQSANHGRVAVDAALGVIGGSGGDVEKDRERFKDRSTAYHKGIDLAATTQIGLRFGADVGQAAIAFEQPHGRSQPMVWNVGGRPPSTLTVDPRSGGFALRGGPTEVTTLNLSRGGGISGGEQPARNLRGIRVPVEAGKASAQVGFGVAEADAEYALHVQPSWFTAVTVDKNASGFTARFERAAPPEATIDWILVR